MLPVFFGGFFAGFCEGKKIDQTSALFLECCLYSCRSVKEKEEKRRAENRHDPVWSGGSLAKRAKCD